MDVEKRGPAVTIDQCQEPQAPRPKWRSLSSVAQRQEPQAPSTKWRALNSRCQEERWGALRNTWEERDQLSRCRF
eukprot:4836667-Amphidinium_carterae.1